MKNYVYSKLFAMLLVTCTAISSFADITIKVNMADVVTFNFSGGRGSALLEAGDNVFKAEDCNGELRVIRDDYDIKCLNLTTGESLKVDQYQEFSKININSYLVNDGDILDVTVSDVRGAERTVKFVFDNPKAGYVATLTNYDISGDQCIGDEFPLDSNEDEYFYPEEDGVIFVPYDYNRRIRIRTNDGYSILSARNPKETNPHYDGYKPNSRGVIEIALVELNVNDEVMVCTAEHGLFTVKSVGGYPEEIEMLDNTNYERLEVSTNPLYKEYTGQTYTVRIRPLETLNTARSVIEKIEVSNNGYTQELEGNISGNLYKYIPKKGDEMTIYLADVSGVNVVVPDITSDGYIYRLDGARIRSTATLPAGIYIDRGHKVVVK